MDADALSSLPPRQPVALIDLVETDTPEAFAARVGQHAEAAGGRVVLANLAVAPMIVPDESQPESDDAKRALVVTHYPTRAAGQAALAARSESGPGLAGETVRTFAARSRRLESWVGRHLPRVVGRFVRAQVPTVERAEDRDAVIRNALVLGEQPDAARWERLARRAGPRPIWMLNHLAFRKTAVYDDDARSAAPEAPISGARAYQRYGSGMMSSLAAVGGRVAWSGRVLGQLAGPDDGAWHQIAIAVYPSPAAMMTMLALPKYRAAHVHRAAALERTRLLATQPLALSD